MNDLTFGATLLALLALFTLTAFTEFTEPPVHRVTAARAQSSDVAPPPDERAETTRCACTGTTR